MPPYDVVVTPPPATGEAVRSTAACVEPSRRLPEINSGCPGRFSLIGVTLALRVTPTTIMPLSESSDPARLAAPRAGDDRTFAELVDELSPRMLKLARVYVTGSAIAEEAVQEAWIVVLRSLDRFEGRSSLSTWVLGIVVNVARARGRHGSRSRPFSSLSTDDDPVIDPGRCLPPDHQRWPGHCAIAPAAVARAGTRDRRGDAGHSGHRRGAAADAAGGDHPAGHDRLPAAGDLRRARPYRR